MLTDSIKPNFLCIGAQKAGTSWLYHNLKWHPEVWLPPYKEIHYFDQIHHPDKSQLVETNRLRLLKNELDQRIQGENISYSYLKFLAHLALSELRDDKWYLSLFSSAGSKRAVGEFTPGYAALPEVGVKHIKSLLGNINIIYILRNPIKRAWSQAVMSKRQDIYEKRHIKDEEWISTIDEWKFLRLNSDYITNIGTYEKYFSTEKILYLFYDEISLNPLILLQRICLFLDIKYNEHYFDKSTLNSVVYPNPKVDIPEKVEQHLIQKYKEQEDWIRERFKPASFER